MNSPTFKDEITSITLCQSQGRRAQMLKFDIIINPYERESDKWHAFNNGWLGAQQESYQFFKTAA